MPYSQAPTNDTYSSHRLSPIVNYVTRKDASGTLYTGMENVLPFEFTENGEKKIYGVTRYPVSGSTVTTGAGLLCRGFYAWEKTIGTIYYFVVVNTKVYTSTNIYTGPWTNVTTLLTNANTPVRFTEFIDSSTNTKSLVMVDGVEGYVFTSDAAGTKITDVDFPSPHVPFPVFLDGYLFLAKANTGDIYNSDLNTPSAWTAGNFISSEMYPDDVQALVRISNYILAVGTTGSEYFYDAGNSPGTPLARVEGATLPFGTRFPNSIAVGADTVMMLSSSAEGESSFRFIEGLKHKEIPNQFLTSYMSGGVISTSDIPSAIRGYFFRQSGALHYAVSFAGTTGSTTVNTYPTFAYSFSFDTWVSFTINSGEPFPVMFSCPAVTNINATLIAGHRNTSVFIGRLMESSQNGDTIDLFATSYSIRQTVRLPFQSFGTMNMKTMSRVGVSYDATSTYPLSPIFTLSWSNGFGSSSSGTIQGASGDGVGGFPFWTQLGVFRERQLILSATIGGSIIWRYIEVDINKHQQ
jgi:hypothetical protein